MKKDRPVSVIKTSDGTFTIVYGMHVVTQDPKDLPPDMDALILETGKYRYIDEPLETITSLSKHVQYKSLFKVAEKRRIPLFFLDLKYRYPDPLLLMADTAFTGIEWMGGMQLLKKKRKGNPLQFLLGLWLILPFLSSVFRLLSSFTGYAQKESGMLKKVSHRIHPEADFLYLTLRNAVIAEKEKYLLTLLGKTPHLVTVLGAGHVGIEDMLDGTDVRRRSVLTKSLPLIKNVIEKKYFYEIVEYRFRNNKWQVEKNHTVPYLQSLLTPLVYSDKS